MIIYKIFVYCNIKFEMRYTLRG